MSHLDQVPLPLFSDGSRAKILHWQILLPFHLWGHRMCSSDSLTFPESPYKYLPSDICCHGNCLVITCSLPVFLWSWRAPNILSWLTGPQSYPATLGMGTQKIFTKIYQSCWASLSYEQMYNNWTYAMSYFSTFWYWKEYWQRTQHNLFLGATTLTPKKI